MSRIVVVHGVGHQTDGELTLHSELFPYLQQGVVRAGGTVESGDVFFVSYGDCFRGSAEVLAPVPDYRADDVTDGYESELLLAWWRRAAEVDPRVVPPDQEVLARSPVWASRALAALSRSRFLAGVSDRLLIGALKEVHLYFSKKELRITIRAIVADAVTDDTRVVVGHSLGSVVAYEVLCAARERPSRSFVTLGSPLGLPNLVFDRLEPAPRPTGEIRGYWPAPVREWTNIADRGDVVAAVEDLRPLFGDEMRQIRVDNGAHAHDMRPYLTEKVTGTAIMAGLNVRR
jgi:pimeloyl-ACP methyl ester carboxylesterase